MIGQEWARVVFDADCTYEEWDKDRECPACPVCGEQFADCPCPGPMMDEEYDYQEMQGNLYAKRKTDK